MKLYRIEFTILRKNNRIICSLFQEFMNSNDITILINGKNNIVILISTQNDGIIHKNYLIKSIHILINNKMLKFKVNEGIT